jgi:GAF domain-containing protein
MRSNRSVVVSDVKDATFEGDPRWNEIGVVPRSLICAPVTKGGRYLGLIELANPHDGRSFRESDGHALTYIGQQFGDFLADRGVMLDPDAVVSSAELSKS